MQREKDTKCSIQREAEPYKTQRARREKGATEYNENECRGKE